MRRTRQHRDKTTASTTLPQSDLGRLDPPRVTAHRPVKRWEERQGEAIANQTALLNMWQQASESLGGLLDLARANAPGDAVGTGTEVIGAAGANQRGFPANMQAVALTNFSGSPMVLTAAPAQSQAPLVGPGVYIVPAGCYRVVPLRGAVVTVYGVAGSSYDMTAYSKPRPMDFAAIAQNPSASTLVTVANPAAGANFSANPSPNAPFSVEAVMFTLTTSATVATRVALLNLAGNIQALPYGVQTASEVVPYTFAQLPAPSATVVAAIPGDTGALPANLVLPPGSTVASGVVLLQAADQISAISLLINTLQPQAVPL